MLISQPILRPKEALKWSISYNREDWVAFDWVSLIFLELHPESQLVDPYNVLVGVNQLTL